MERAALGLVALHLGKIDDGTGGAWRESCLHLAARALDLSPVHAEAFEPLLQESNSQTVEEQSTPFMAVLQAMSYESRSAFLRDVLVLTATNLGYCARSRTLLKRMAMTLAVEWDEVAAVEVALGAYMKAELDCMTADVKDNRWKRYAQIGGAAVVGGAALALTAGTAAPALGILAGAGVWGASTLSAVMSVAMLQAVFGVAGAGLAGYKMRRRTKGVNEFEFLLQHGGTQGLAVTICVSGWLRDAADVKRPWGVALGAEDIPLRERLQRFFHVHGDLERARQVRQRLVAFRETKMSSAFGRPAQSPSVGAFSSSVGAFSSSATDVSEPPLSAGVGSSSNVRTVLSGVKTFVTRSEGVLTPEEEEEILLPIRREFGVATVDVGPPESAALAPQPTLVSAVERLIKGAAESGGGVLHTSIRATASSSSSSSSSSMPSTAPTAAPLPTPTASSISKSISSSSLPSSRTEPSQTVAGASGTPVPMSAAARARVAAEAAAAEPRTPEPLIDGELTLEGDGGGSPEEAEAELAGDNEEVWWWRDIPGGLHCGDHYVLRWETELLQELAASTTHMVASAGLRTAVGQTIGQTIGMSLMSVMIMPMAMVSLAGMIDSTWTLATERADAAGRLLAEVLIRREQGTRPVTLVGFSFGARMILTCLHTLEQHHRQWRQQQALLGEKAVSPGRVRVRLLGGTHNFTQRINAYVFLRLGSSMLYKLKDAGPVHADAEREMVWESDITFKLDDPTKLATATGDGCTYKVPLMVELWDKRDRLTPDRMLGHTSLNLQRCLQHPNKVFRKTLALRPTDDMSDDAHTASPGEVRVEITFEPVAGDYTGAAGIVENVVLMGTPAKSSSEEQWAAAASMVAGRLVNCYSENDWVLAYIFRYKQMQVRVAGIEPVPCPSVENVDVSDLIKSGWSKKGHPTNGHSEYIHRQREILARVNLDKCMPVGRMGAEGYVPNKERERDDGMRRVSSTTSMGEGGGGGGGGSNGKGSSSKASKEGSRSGQHPNPAKEAEERRRAAEEMADCFVLEDDEDETPLLPSAAASTGSRRSNEAVEAIVKDAVNEMEAMRVQQQRDASS